jgi:hypothetical protein
MLRNTYLVLCLLPSVQFSYFLSSEVEIVHRAHIRASTTSLRYEQTYLNSLTPQWNSLETYFWLSTRKLAVECKPLLTDHRQRYPIQSEHAISKKLSFSFSIFIPIQEKSSCFRSCIQISKLKGRCHDATRSMLNAPIPPNAKGINRQCIIQICLLFLMELFGVVREEGVDWCRLRGSVSRCDVEGKGRKRGEKVQVVEKHSANVWKRYERTSLSRPLRKSSSRIKR